MACGRGFKSRQLHHYPPVKSLSLPLNNPVGPQAWRGFSLLLADLASIHSSHPYPFPALSRSLFSTSCEPVKSVVRKMLPLIIKDLGNYWDKQFFLASQGQCQIERERNHVSLRKHLQQHCIGARSCRLQWRDEKIIGVRHFLGVAALKRTWGPTSAGKLFTSTPDWSFTLDEDKFSLRVTGRNPLNGSVLDTSGLQIAPGVMWATVRFPLGKDKVIALDGIPNDDAHWMIKCVQESIRRPPIFSSTGLWSPWLI